MNWLNNLYRMFLESRWIQTEPSMSPYGIIMASGILHAPLKTIKTIEHKFEEMRTQFSSRTVCVSAPYFLQHPDSLLIS